MIYTDNPSSCPLVRYIIALNGECEITGAAMPTEPCTSTLLQTTTAISRTYRQLIIHQRNQKPNTSCMLHPKEISYYKIKLLQSCNVLGKRNVPLQVLLTLAKNAGGCRKVESCGRASAIAGVISQSLQLQSLVKFASLGWCYMSGECAKPCARRPVHFCGQSGGGASIRRVT
jgi:hypothetical protein